MEVINDNFSFGNSPLTIFVSKNDSENDSSKSSISFNNSMDITFSNDSDDKDKFNHPLLNNTVSISENDLKINDTDYDSGLCVEDEQNDSITEIIKPLKQKCNNGDDDIKYSKTHVCVDKDKNAFFYNIKEIKRNNDEKIDYHIKKNQEKIIQKNFDVIFKNFEAAFRKEDKKLLISAINDLNYLSVKYDFPYVTSLSIEWKRILVNFNLKFTDISININKIQEILEKMLSEIGNKESKFSYSNLKSDSTKTINKPIFKNLEKINPFSNDLFQIGNLDENNIDNLINELDNNDEKSFFSDDKKIYYKKNVNSCKYNTDKNLKDYDTYGYPFKDESYCGIF